MDLAINGEILTTIFVTIDCQWAREYETNSFSPGVNLLWICLNCIIRNLTWLNLNLTGALLKMTNLENIVATFMLSNHRLAIETWALSVVNEYVKYAFTKLSNQNIISFVHVYYIRILERSIVYACHGPLYTYIHDWCYQQQKTKQFLWLQKFYFMLLESDSMFYRNCLQPNSDIVTSAYN